MSGIAAIFDFSGRPVLQTELDILSRGISHRAADGMQQWIDDGACAGMVHSALHTNAEAAQSVQPLKSPCGQFVVIFDGYVSNWEELRAQLISSGCDLHDRSDAELVLQSYLKWGADCPKYVDGEYAFVIWDGRRSRAFLARDHHGLRPLYFRWSEMRLIVCSEIKPIVDAMAPAAALNYGFVAEIMANALVSKGETVWQGIERLPAAHTMTVSPGGSTKTRFWSLPTQVSVRYRSTAEYVEHYRAVFTESVRRASKSDRPLGAELSGGLDSSATYCTAHSLLSDGGLPAPSIIGFTCISQKGSVADEIEYAREAAQHVGGSLQEVPLFQPGLDWFAAQSSQSATVPTYTNGADALYLEDAMRDQGCRAALNGMGGDQWLDGSELFVYDSLRTGDWRGLLEGVRGDIPYRGRVGALRFAMRQALVACLPGELRQKHHRRRLNRAGVQGPFWLAPELQEEVRERRERFDDRARFDGRIARIKHDKYNNAQFQLAIELMEQQRSASHLEGRSPMLSRAFIEFSAQTPEHIRFRGGMTKFVHREAMRGTVPQSILEREGKATFPETEAQRLQLLEFLENALEKPDTLKLCDREGLQQLIGNYSNDATKDYWAHEAWTAFCGLILME